MQNVLPILALRPDRVFHLVTPKVAGRSHWIAEAARQAGLVPSCDDIQLSAMPEIVEVVREVKRLIAQTRDAGGVPVINFTGGTKLMSIGAYAAAMTEKADSLYVDTENGHFADGKTGEALDGLFHHDLSFTPYRRMLRVDFIAVAHGCERVTAGKPSAPYAPLADHMLNHPQEEQATWEGMHGGRGLCPGGCEPRSPGGWLDLCAKEVHVPDAVARLAVEAGLLEHQETGGSLRLACPDRKALESLAAGNAFHPTPAYFNAIAPLQFALAFLSGGWWEVAIAGAARKSGRFRDVRWSVQAGRRGFGGSMEEDVVAVDGVRVAYFSCKRGGRGAKLSRQLEEMDASARRLGGHFVSKFFCVYQAPGAGIRESIFDRARSLGVRVVTRTDLLKGDGFQS